MKMKLTALFVTISLTANVAAANIENTSLLKTKIELQTNIKADLTQSIEHNLNLSYQQMKIDSLKAKKYKLVSYKTKNKRNTIKQEFLKAE